MCLSQRPDLLHDHLTSNPCTESLASKNWIFSFFFILGSHNNYPWWIGCIINTGSHCLRKLAGTISITLSGSTGSMFSGISDVGCGTRPKGRKAELPLATGSLWANPSSFTMAIGNPLLPWKIMEALKGKWCIHGGFSSAMFDDRRVSYSTCAYEILSGHVRINPLFQRRINVASDARQRLRNSVRQHWLWLSVSSKTRPGVH